MIKANELRVGNWVAHHGETDVPFRLGAQAIFNIATGFLDRQEAYSPIPLTPEVLEKCGFEKTYSGKFLMLDKMNRPFDIIIDLNKKSVGVGDNDEYLLSYFPHLHQLQNLFYCLRGEELEYKP